MIRLFVAIDLPDDIRAMICTMGGSIPGSRPVPPDQLHLTLKFIGEVETGALLDIKESLHRIAFPEFTLHLQGVGHFPPRGAPKVLWVGVAPVTEVVSLRNAVERNLSQIGIERERRKFSPHVTLARLKNSPLKRVRQFLAGNCLFDSPSFRVEDFKLYSSILTSKGAVHTVEDIIPLQAPQGQER